MSAEKLVYVAPLGLRLWDEGAAAVVSDALDVRATLEGRSGSVVVASRSASGHFVFHRLPGFGGFERGELRVDDEERLPPARRFVVTVTHRRAEYLPVRFVCQAPQLGLATPEVAKGERPLVPLCGPVPLPSLPLFPAAHRPVHGGLAVVRAELRLTGDRKAPAKWALLEASFAGETIGRSLADPNGRVLLVFPFPRLDLDDAADTWSLQFSAFYKSTAATDERADLDAVKTYPRIKLRQGRVDAFADALTRDLHLHPNRPLDLQVLELQP